MKGGVRMFVVGAILLIAPLSSCSYRYIDIKEVGFSDRSVALVPLQQAGTESSSPYRSFELVKQQEYKGCAAVRARGSKLQIFNERLEAIRWHANHFLRQFDERQREWVKSNLLLFMMNYAAQASAFEIHRVERNPTYFESWDDTLGWVVTAQLYLQNAEQRKSDMDRTDHLHEMDDLRTILRQGYLRPDLLEQYLMTWVYGKVILPKQKTKGERQDVAKQMLMVLEMLQEEHPNFLPSYVREDHEDIERLLIRWLKTPTR